MRVCLIAIVLTVVNISKIECRTANEFYTFRDAKATSVFIAPNNDSEKHGPNRAFQIGSSYWSSEGQHNDTDFISWTGELYDKALISQVNIYWEYAPKEVEISFSLTGDDFNVVMPFRQTFENKRSYEENFRLDSPYETKFVRLTMRGAINTYFGIRHIHLVGYGYPLFMIKSGISSKEGEMCLQLEEGNTENQPRVVLDLCVNAIAASDGREIWRQNSRQQIVSAISYPEKCLTTVEASKHGPVILDDCNDDSCTWEFMGNSQISLKNGNQLCLTQQDDYSNVAGMGNLVEKFNSEITVTSSGSSDQHEERFAVDMDNKTYWASLLFPDDGYHVASFTIDFGKMVHCSRVVIDWEYQPLSYIIEASSDKITFKEIAKNLSNSAHLTTDSFPGTDLKQIRVVMLKPHYVHGVVSGGYVYGIRNISVLTNNLITVVGDCRAAANSGDARDKYFVSYLSSFEPMLSKKITSMESDLHNVITEVSNELNHLKESLDESANCMDEKKDYDNHIESIVKKEQSLWKLFNKSNLTKCDQSEVQLSIFGENKYNPSEDCYFIKEQFRNAKSGFYWIQPPCSKDPLRVYCDMDSLSSIYVWNGKDNAVAGQHLNNIRSPSSLRLQCASYGLEPFVVKSKHQIEEIKRAIHLMGFDSKLDSYVPLAYRFGSDNKFKDFMNLFSFISFPIKKVTNMLDNGNENNQEKQNEVTDDLHMNAVGLSMTTSEVEAFDMETSQLSAIVCSTNATDDVTTPIELDCEDMFGRSKKLYGSLNTNILVKCVQDCSQKENLYVYGTGGLYSDHTSICLAAIHSGVIGSKGTFVIAIENGLKYYEGTKQNGVQSMFYNKTWHGLKDIIKEKEENNLEHNGPDCKYSIRILPLEKRCPIVKEYGSFLQLPENKNNENTSESNSDKKEDEKKAQNESKNDVNQNVENNIQVNKDQVQEQTVEGDNKYDPNTIKMANKVIDIMDSMYGVDNKTVTNVIEQIALVIAQSKKHLRSLEPIFNKQNEQITTMFDNGTSLTSKVESLYDTLEANKTLYSNLLSDENNKNIDVSSDFVLDYRKMPFSKTFSVYDTSMTSGKSHWGYSNSPLEGHESYVVQSSDVDSEILSEGSYAFLNHYKYFDFESSFDLLANSEGSMGVVFRAHDRFNFYLFQMNYSKSNKQLLKVEDGVPYVLATNPDEGYKKNHWYTVKIVCKYYYIEVYCDTQLIFRVIDTSFLYGYFGLYSVGANASFHFDNIKIDTRDVQHVTSPLRIERLKNMKCCNYVETFTGNFEDNYHLINPPYSTKTTWSYEELFNGNHRVIHQIKSSFDPHDLGSLAILKNDRYCKSGYFRFRVLPQCERGTVGAVVNYKDERNMHLVEINSKELRIREVSNGNVKVLSKEEAKLGFSKWNVIEVELSKDSIKARAKVNVEHNFVLTGLMSSYDYSVSADVENSENFSLGLKSSACESSYFDNVHVSQTEPKELNTNFLSTTMTNAWVPCVSVNLLQRKTLCKQMHPSSNPEECLSNFCSHCCNHHTRLLGDQVTQNCVTNCNKNNLLFKINNAKFQSYLSSCTSLEGPGFDHCRGEVNCLVQSCKLCCNSGYYNQFEDGRKMVESAYCENKCKIRV